MFSYGKCALRCMARNPRFPVVAKCTRLAWLARLTVGISLGTSLAAVAVVEVPRRGHCEPGKVAMCHRGRPRCVDPEDVPDHRDHGDRRGRCLDGGRCEPGEVAVCHRGRPRCVDPEDVPDHWEHGDRRGACWDVP